MKRFLRAVYFIARFPVIYMLKVAGAPFLRGKKDRIKKILVIRLDRIGDFIVTLPLIENLRLAYPQAGIDVLVRRPLAELVSSIPGVCPVEYDSVFSVTARLRRAQYDIAIDPVYDCALPGALLAYLSGAAVRIGFKKGRRDMLFNYPVADAGLSGLDMARVHLALLRPLGVPVRVIIPRLPVSRQEGGPLTVGIHPGAHYPSQRWPARRFAELAALIVARYRARVLVIGGPNDRGAVDAIMRDMDPRSARAVFPGIKELVTVLAGCDLLVCNNSGPLHLAAAVGTATVSTMGPTIPGLWSPPGGRHRVVRAGLACSPCSRGTCGKHACMDAISVEEMFGQVEEMLGRIRVTEGPEVIQSAGCREKP